MKLIEETRTIKRTVLFLRGHMSRLVEWFLWGDKSKMAELLRRGHVNRLAVLLHSGGRRAGSSVFPSGDGSAGAGESGHHGQKEAEHPDEKTDAGAQKKNRRHNSGGTGGQRPHTPVSGGKDHHGEIAPGLYPR